MPYQKQRRNSLGTQSTLLEAEAEAEAEAEREHDPSEIEKIESVSGRVEYRIYGPKLGLDLQYSSTGPC